MTVKMEEWHIKYFFRVISIGAAYYWLAAVLGLAVYFFAKKISRKERVLLALLVSYLFLAFSCAVFSRKASSEMQFNYTPFWTIRTIMTGGKAKAWLKKELLFNTIMLIPVGLLLPAVLKKQRFRKTMIIGIGISIIIEITQLLTRRGFSETDDIITNTIGTLIGFGIYSLISRGSVLMRNMR